MSSVQFAQIGIADMVATQVQVPQVAGHVPSPAQPTAATPAKGGEPPADTRAAPTAAQAKEALAYLQSHAASVAPNLQFSIDKDTGRLVIKVIDATTKEVIRQIPPDEILRLSKALDKLQGMLLDREA